MVRSSGAQTLPRRERLRRAGEFQAVFQHGRKIDCGGFTLLWAVAPGERRVGFAVSRRVRGAVGRNRVRRRLREAFRREKELFPAGICMVLIGRPRALRMELAELATDMSEAARLVGTQSAAWARRGAGAGPAR